VSRTGGIKAFMKQGLPAAISGDRIGIKYIGDCRF